MIIIRTTRTIMIIMSMEMKMLRRRKRTMMILMIRRRLTMTMEAPHNKKSERNGGTSAARGRVWGNFDFWSADLVIIGKNLFSELQNWISSVARFQDCRLFHRRNCRSAEMLGDIIVRNIRW